ncbi:MAG: hypothetical protein ACPGU6_04790 [Tenacibaculum sp.]
MKKIKLSIYTILLSLALVSCESETTDLVEGTVKETQQIEVGFSDTNNNAVVLEDGGKASLEVSISKALPYEATVELEITSSDNSLKKASGADELTYDAMVKIPAGSTSVAANFSFINDEKSDGSETYTVVVKNVTTSSTLTGQYITNSIDQAKLSRTILVFDTLPDVIKTTEGAVDMNLSWLDGRRDMDLYILTENARPTRANTIDFSEGFRPSETVTLPAAQADGKFYLFVNQYRFTADVDYAMKYTFPDGQMLDLSGTVSDDSVIYTINKITNGSEIIYLISKV